MAKFKYSLQSILNIKLKMETQAKQEFSAAVGALNEEEKKLELFEQEKINLENQSKALLIGQLDFHKIYDNRQSIRYQGERIEMQKENVHRAEENVELTREKLKEVMIERKTHETLREKAFEAFLLEENRKESKSIDELTSYVYGQKKEV